MAGSGNTLTATYAASSLAVGSHSITAVYAADANNATNTSSALTQTINQGQPQHCSELGHQRESASRGLTDY